MDRHSDLSQPLSPLPPWQQGKQNPGLPSFALDVNSVKEKRVIELAFQIERERRTAAARNALWCEVFSLCGQNIKKKNKKRKKR